MKKQPRILLVDDDDLIISMLSRTMKSEGYDVQAVMNAGSVISKVKSWLPAVVLLDIRMPERSGIEILEDIVTLGLQTQVVMLTADDTAETAVKAMKLGAADYLTKPFNVDEVKIIIKGIIERGYLKREVAYLRKVQSEAFEREIIGGSPAIKAIKQNIERMSEASISSLLITGESGTGKELVARYAHRLIHEGDPSVFSPFIKVNCAALPDHLLESELFGYEKGSFTDAKVDKKGLFELAQGGSILLDEIGDMKPALQSKLLRVLEERVIRPIGGREEISIEVTVIATTNKNLAKAVDSGEFRMDLFFRLNTFYVHIPPLRERADDIPVLAGYYLSQLAKRYNRQTVKRFSPAAEKLLVSYGWPGNVRELRNLVERIVVLEPSEVITPEQLPNWLTEHKGVTSVSRAGEPTGGEFVLPDSGISLDDVEKNLISQALERTRNNKAQAAKLLGISYDTLRYQVKKLGLE